MEKKKLTGIFDAIGWAVNFVLAEKRWWWIIKAQLAYLAACVVLAVPIVAAAGLGGYFSYQDILHPATIIVAVVAGLLGIVVFSGFTSAYFSGMYIEIYNDRKPPLMELIKKSWSQLIRFFGLSFAVGIIVFLGFLLLIVPGIIWSMTYVFAMYLMYEKPGSIKETMVASKQMTDGYKWELFKKWLVLGFVAVVISGAFSGLTQGSESIILNLISFLVSLVVNMLTPLVYLKYYYELKK